MHAGASTVFDKRQKALNKLHSEQDSRRVAEFNQKLAREGQRPTSAPVGNAK